MSEPFDAAQGKPVDPARGGQGPGRPAGEVPGESDPVDAYLERLDHLLSARETAPPPQVPEQAEAAPAEGSGRPAAPSPIADAFAALLALEEGEPGAQPVRLVTGGGEPRITEALVEELTRRVIAALAPDAVRAVVADVVSEVAERLVREEIERIRNRHV